jgi:hypothetical protein
MITLTPRVRMRQLREAPAQLSKLAAALEVSPAQLEDAAEANA